MHAANQNCPCRSRLCVGEPVAWPPQLEEGADPERAAQDVGFSDQPRPRAGRYRQRSWQPPSGHRRRLRHHRADRSEHRQRPRTGRLPPPRARRTAHALHPLSGRQPPSSGRRPRLCPATAGHLHPGTRAPHVRQPRPPRSRVAHPGTRSRSQCLMAAAGLLALPACWRPRRSPHQVPFFSRREVGRGEAQRGWVSAVKASVRWCRRLRGPERCAGPRSGPTVGCRTRRER